MSEVKQCTCEKGVGGVGEENISTDSGNIWNVEILKNKS